MMMFLVAEHQHRSKQSLHLSTAPDYPHQYSESVLVLRDPDDVQALTTFLHEYVYKDLASSVSDDQLFQIASDLQKQRQL